MNDTTLLDKLKRGENNSFRLLYKVYFPYTSSYITNNHGSLEDAEDVFQDAVIILLENVSRTDFTLTSSLKTYLFAIVRNIWLKRLRNKKNKAEVYLDNDEDFEVTELEEEQLQEDKTSGIYTWLTAITAHCQKILNALFFYNEPMENLMGKMGWKNKHTAANQQYKCIQQIKREKDKLGKN